MRQLFFIQELKYSALDISSYSFHYSGLMDVQKFSSMHLRFDIKIPHLVLRKSIQLLSSNSFTTISFGNAISFPPRLGRTTKLRSYHSFCNYLVSKYVSIKIYTASVSLKLDHATGNVIDVSKRRRGSGCARSQGG